MKVLNKLTIKHLTMNKKRTIISIIGITLSTALMVGIGLLFSSLHQMLLDTVVSTYGEHHVIINNIDADDFDKLKNDSNIDKIYWKDNYEIQNANGKIFPGDYDLYDQKYLDKLTLKEGRLPNIDTEILIYEEDEASIKSFNLPCEIGKSITIDIYQYKGLSLIEDSHTLYDDELDTNLWKKIGEKEVTIVGIIEGDFEGHELPFISLFSENAQNGSLQAEIIFKNPNQVQNNTDNIISYLKNNDRLEISYNDALLFLYGESTHTTVNNTFIGIIIFVLTLISIGCIIVIYNSFAISVTERKKQFGLFSSIGATSKQIRKSVYFEALIVGSIGIILGIVGAFIGIYAVLEIVNHLIKNFYDISFKLAVNPTFIIIPIIFMILTVFISAYLPARRASKISPIKAIRLNDDIKIKAKKVRTSKIIRKVFDMEGDLALKNIKRNKKKYRITIVSLFISIVLYISFSAFIDYGLGAANLVLGVREYDIRVTMFNETITSSKEVVNEMKQIDGIEETMVISVDSFNVNVPNEYLTKEYINLQIPSTFGFDFSVITLEDDVMKGFLQEHNISMDYLTNNKGILVNRYVKANRDEDEIKIIKIEPFKRNALKQVTLSSYNYSSEPTFERTIDVVEVRDTIDFIEADYDKPIIFISENTRQNLFVKEDDIVSTTLLIKGKAHWQIEEALNNYIIENELPYYDVQNITKRFEIQNNIILAISILLYGFIALVTAIGITSVFNTINTSMQLRRKEFAVLRSVGLSPKGFNKMLRFESIFYGLKALLYALPVSFIIVIWLNTIFSNVIEYGIRIPWRAIGIAIIAVFIITFITMNYATRKIKKENILEGIREENI